MKQIAVDSSMKKLSTEALTLQIGPAESPLASFLLVLSFYGESLGGRGFVTVLPTIALQAPLDRARGELPSDTRTLISHWEKFRGKTGEIWRSVITNYASNRLMKPMNVMNTAFLWPRLSTIPTSGHVRITVLHM